MPTPLLPASTGDPSVWDGALHAFLIEKGERSGSRRTVEGYRRMLRPFFADLGTTPDRVTAADVLGFAQGIGRSGRRPSSVTVAARIACVSSYYGFLIRRGLVSANPCATRPSRALHELDDVAATPEPATVTPAAWPAPVPLIGRPAPPRFPVECLPGWVAAFVRAEATATQTPVDMAAMFALAGLATVAAGRVWVEALPGWSEGLNLYIAVAMEPGSRKRMSLLIRPTTMRIAETRSWRWDDARCGDHWVVVGVGTDGPGSTT